MRGRLVSADRAGCGSWPPIEDSFGGSKKGGVVALSQANPRTKLINSETLPLRPFRFSPTSGQTGAAEPPRIHGASTVILCPASAAARASSTAV